LKVGIAWAGNPGHRRDRDRSIRLEALAPLGAIPGVTLYSLQKGAGVDQLRSAPPGLRVIDHTADLHAVADTAALLENLDLVVTVDTAVCHVAGALKKPVWVMAAATWHWVWGLEGGETRWYPTMRLFRQEKLGDWAPVTERVAGELSGLAARRAREGF
jgi:hypothetical protein